jgi:hypothetical protein
MNNLVIISILLLACFSVKGQSDFQIFCLKNGKSKMIDVSNSSFNVMVNDSLVEVEIIKTDENYVLVIVPKLEVESTDKILFQFNWKGRLLSTDCSSLVTEGNIRLGCYYGLIYYHFTNKKKFDKFTKAIRESGDELEMKKEQSYPLFLMGTICVEGFRFKQIPVMSGY